MKTKITTSLLLLFILSAALYSQSQVISNPCKSINGSLQRIASYTEGEYYFESFEGRSFPPAGWQVFNARGRHYWDNHSYAARHGSGSAFVNYDMTIIAGSRLDASMKISQTANYEVIGDREDSVEIDWLISPRYSALQGDSLIFFAKFNNSSQMGGETLFVFVSLTEEVPADSASLNAAFSDTLFAIPIDTADSWESRLWRKYSVSLDKYAGQKIYIGFKDHGVYSYGVFIDDIQLGKRPAADIAALDAGINMYLKKGAELKPVGYFINAGYETQSFYVSCEIPGAGYANKKYCENIAPDSVVEIYFDAWTSGEKGAYKVYVYADMESDLGRGNDTLIATTRVLAQLEPAVWHTEAKANAYYSKAASYGGGPAYGFNKYIYAFTSDANDRVNDLIMKYDKDLHTWTHAGNLPQDLEEFIPIQVGGKIYIAGGRAKNVFSSKLYIYDTESGALDAGADMLEPSVYYVAGSYGDSLLYIMGGWGNGGVVENIQIYNINTTSWAYGSPLNKAGEDRFFMGGSIAGNKIILVGGDTGLMDFTDAVDIGLIDAENPYNITWTSDIFPGGYAYSTPAGSWYGKNRKYMFFYEDELWAYNVETDEWLYCPKPIASAEGSRSNLVPVVRNDSVYIVAISGTVTEWLYIGKDERLIGVNEEPNLSAPKEYSLSQNYPNPFNPSTKIKYSLREPGHVSLTVYDMLGREVKTLINELMSAGEHEVIFNAAELNLSSGLYLYRIRSGSFVQTKKLMLIK
ncbi:MAG TPA: choice-of-anchor J domain-containing protein [Ignavibacteriales bacterium]|nr:choice-of-anchor J domain-containing protein [Ignavibacteriales bacterium]